MEPVYTTTVVTATTTVAPTLELILVAVQNLFVHYLNKLELVPGGQIILRYIRSSYKNDPVRLLFELALFVFAVHYFLLAKRKENKSEIVKFLRREIDELVGDWEPEPLVTAVPPLERWQLALIPAVQGPNGSHVRLCGHDADVVNLALYDFLLLNEDPSVRGAAAGVIATAGVGACGPPNFYGLQDVHVRLEEDLARFLGTEQAILYGQDFMTAALVLPAFMKRGDLCVVDSGVNLAIQKALIVSRCNIEWFEHNDTAHLAQILAELKPTLDREPLHRRFIVTEGVFLNLGDVCPLPAIVELKNRYKYRVFLDESMSIGALGLHGRGVAEHFGVARLEVAITIGSFATAFASLGGFCAGERPMVQHQRINSSAYTFSASLPPYLAKALLQAIKRIELLLLIAELHQRVGQVHRQLATALAFFHVTSNAASPVVHLTLAAAYRKRLGLPQFYGSTHFLTTGKQARALNEFDRCYNLESFLLQTIIDGVLREAHILVSRSKTILEQENLPLTPPHLLVMVNAGVSLKELELLAHTLATVANKVCAAVSSEAQLAALEPQLLQYK